MTRLAVSEVVFPWMYPNINARTSTIRIYGQNISLGLNVSGVVVLATGFYTPYQLSEAMTNALRNAFLSLIPDGGADIEVKYGTGGLPRFTVGFPGFVPSEYIFSFLPMTYGETYNAFGLPDTYKWNYPSSSKQLFDVMGFTSSNSNNYQYQFGQATLAQAVRYIDIICPQLTANQGLPDATSQAIADSALCRVYLADGDEPVGVDVASEFFAPPGTEPFVIYRTFPQPKQIQWNAMMPIQGRLQFQVVDDNGEVLPAVDGGIVGVANLVPYVSYADWSMSLLLTEN
jgi:hypothetical protein